MDIEKYTPEEHAGISNQVRIQLGDRLERMLRTLEPLISGDFGDPPMPGHLQAYLSAIKLFGNLYQVEKPPRPDSDLVDAAQVEKMIEAARIAAVADTLAAVQAQKQIASTAEYTSAAQKLRNVLDGRVDEETG